MSTFNHAAEQGREAYEAGESRTSNKYNKDTQYVAWYHWDNAWYLAESLKLVSLKLQEPE